MLESVVLERFMTGQRHGRSTTIPHKRQRVYILPTRQGISFFVLLLTMLLGAINYNNSMAFLLTFLLGSLFLIAILHTYRNLAGLVVISHTPEPVFAGDTARFPFSIDNRNGNDHVALELCCWPRQRFWQRWKKVFPVSRVNMTADSLEQTTVLLHARERGKLALGRIRISTRYPLGLCRAWSYFESDQACIVYPKPAGSDILPPARPATDQEGEGEKGGTDDFTGFRQYRPGDSIRNIAWKKLAHDDQLLVKRFSGSGGKQLLLTWRDTGGSSIESRLSQLCLWILNAEQRGYRYGLIIPGTRIEPGHGRAHMQQCLEILALCNGN